MKKIGLLIIWLLDTTPRMTNTTLQMCIADGLGEHRRWSQNGHNKSAILTS